jgi:hypothetical protein
MNVELDRAMAAREEGYHAALLKVLQPNLTTKSDIIVGVPVERCKRQAATHQGALTWPWSPSACPVHEAAVVPEHIEPRR